MRRLPLLASFVLFLALCASIAYWGMQLFEPPSRPVAAPPRAASADVKLDAAAGLFGPRAGKTAVASNYQLRGIIMAGRDSVAILSADGKPAQAVRMNKEIAPGVTVKEVNRDHVLLTEAGVTKRVELPESVKAQLGLAGNTSGPAQPGRPGAVPRMPNNAASTQTSPPPAPPPASAAVPAMPPAMPQQNTPPVPGMPPTAVAPGAAAPAPSAGPSGVPPGQSGTAPPSMVINPGAPQEQPAAPAQPPAAPAAPNASPAVPASPGGIAAPAMRQSPGSSLGTR